MRAYRTEDYFSVPVDRALLRDYRQKAGFRRAQDFENELRHRGYAISYTSIEYSHGAKSGRSKIRGDSAKIIAEVLGTAPNNLFPGYDEAKALSKSTDPIPVQKTPKHMDIFFKVPVDLNLLKYHRERCGYFSKRQLVIALHKNGYDINYGNVECPARYLSIKYVRGDVAAEIAAFLGMPPNELFPGYDEAKAAAEHSIKTNYYKPFTSVIQRNAAILEEMDVIKSISLKYKQSIRSEGVPLGDDEVISIGYEALCDVADRAFRVGIPSGVKFGAYACESVKNALRQKYRASKYYNIDVFSLEAYTYAHDLAGPFNLEEYVSIRDEAWNAVQTLSLEQKQDVHIRQLIAVCFPQTGIQHV